MRINLAVRMTGVIPSMIVTGAAITHFSARQVRQGQVGTGTAPDQRRHWWLGVLAKPHHQIRVPDRQSLAWRQRQMVRILIRRQQRDHLGLVAIQLPQRHGQRLDTGDDGGGR